MIEMGTPAEERTPRMANASGGSGNGGRSSMLFASFSALSWRGYYGQQATSHFLPGAIEVLPNVRRRKTRNPTPHFVKGRVPCLLPQR
jgi:hypothetical protein